MGTLNDFQLKQRKYMPVFPKASGKPTVYIEGYPSEEKRTMPADEFHTMQTQSLFDQFLRYFQAHPYVHVSMDSFVYYREGNIRKVVAPDSMEEHRLRVAAEEQRDAAEAVAAAEAQSRQEVEAEVEQLRAQLANRQDSDL